MRGSVSMIGRSDGGMEAAGEAITLFHLRGDNRTRRASETEVYALKCRCVVL